MALTICNISLRYPQNVSVKFKQTNTKQIICYSLLKMAILMSENLYFYELLFPIPFFRIGLLLYSSCLGNFAKTKNLFGFDCILHLYNITVLQVVLTTEPN